MALNWIIDRHHSDLGSMYATDIQTTDRRQTASSLNAPAY